MPRVAPAPLLAALRRPAGARLAIVGMGVALGLCLLAGARAGAMPLSSGQVLAIVLDHLGISSPWHFSAQQASVVWAIRFPRLLLGALIGVLAALIGRPVSRWCLRLANQPWRDLTRGAAFACALAGSFSHILFDGIMHADMQPFWPLMNGNPLLDLIGITSLHWLCLGLGVCGFVAIKMKKEDTR